MSTSEPSPASSAAEEQQVQQWLSDADAAAKAEDWERTIALYRQALEFDRYLQGVEAKLQWALRMRDIDKLYRDGKAKLEAGQYEAALVPLRKARVMYASHYKDIDDLIVQAQTALQKLKWQGRPQMERRSERPAARKEKSDAVTNVRRDPTTQSDLPMLLGGLVIIIAIIAGAVYLSVTNGGRVVSAVAATPTTVAASAPGALPTVVGTPTVTASGLQIIDLQVGDGAAIESGQTASVNYTGYLTDGAKFDSSLDRGQPFEFKLGAGNVIKGWDEGIVGMKVGGQRRLIIPPALGYGATGSPPRIPPNATLIFDVELLAIK